MKVKTFSLVRSALASTFLLGALVVAAPASASAATIFSDGFGAGGDDSTFNEAPVWTEGGAGAEKRAASSGNDSASANGGRFAVVFGTNGSSKGYLCTTVSAVGFSSVQLSYLWRGDSDSGNPSDNGIVEFKSASGGSCSDSSGWTQLQDHDMQADGSWSTQSPFTNAGFNNTSFLIRFRADTNQGDEHFRVDGVSVTGDAIPTTGTLTVTKTVVGGPKVVADFPLTVDGFSVTSGVATTTSAGSHTVAETSAPNYVATWGGDCNSSGVVTVTAGNSASCALTNTYTPFTGSLTVTKTVDNAGGGTGVVADFPLFLDGLSIASGVATTTVEGLRVVSETASSSYVATFGGACDASGNVTVSSTTPAVCTITNTFVPPPTTGTIEILKDVVAPNAGAADDTTPFTVTLTAEGYSSTTTFAEGLSAIFRDLVPGSYTIGEAAQAGYQLIGISPATTTSVSAGATTTVTVTNRQISAFGELTVTKEVVGAPEGIDETDFPLFLDGLSIASGVATTTAAGERAITETSMEGYSATWSETAPAAS